MGWTTCVRWPAQKDVLHLPLLTRVPKKGARRTSDRVRLPSHLQQILNFITHEFSFTLSKPDSWTWEKTLAFTSKQIVTPVQAQIVPEGFQQVDVSRIFKKSAYESGKVARPEFLPPFSPQRRSLYSIESRATEQPEGLIQLKHLRVHRFTPQCLH